MKNIFLIIVLFFLISCKKESEKTINMKLGELALYKVCTLETSIYHNNNGEKDKVKDTVISENKLIEENLMSQNYNQKDYNKPTLKKEVYYLDDSKKIKFKYNNSGQVVVFNLQKDKENLEKHILLYRFNNLVLVDLNNDGVKEIIISSGYGDDYSTNNTTMVYSVFK